LREGGEANLKNIELAIVHSEFNNLEGREERKS
jgi:hypothetical protein